MAHLALAIDADPFRRRQFLLATQQALRNFSQVSMGQVEVGELALTWARNPAGPYSVVQSPEGCALLLGYALNEAGCHLEAASLYNAWSCGECLPAHDGYFAAVVYHVERGLAILSDPLGFFPVYHNGGRRELVAGSSPALCTAHRSVVAQLSVPALAGILLTNGLVGDCPLMAGLKRLEAGRQLEWTSAGGCCERESFQWQPEDTPGNASAEEVRERVDAEISQAIKRHRPPCKPASLLLSGGLDSRLMAGYLSSLGIDYSPVTWGRTSDFEFRAAQGVAESLGRSLQRDPRDASAETFVLGARQKAFWEHLSGGFGSIDAWLEINEPAPQAPYFWSGYVLEDVLGGVALESGRDPKTDRWSFETFLKKLNRWGMTPQALECLLRPCATSDLLPAMMAEMKRAYERPEWTAEQQSVAARLRSRTRFHIGAVLHRLSFRSWPLLPMLDRRILQLAFNLPPHVAIERRLQMALLQSRAPALTRVPFDTNSFRFSHSQAKQCRYNGSVLKRVTDWFAYRGRRWYWQAWKRDEPRRYYRLYDLNTPGWRAIRLDAEVHRRAAYEHFDRATFDRLLPSPLTKIKLSNPFTQGASCRALLGALLWQATFLPNKTRQRGQPVPEGSCLQDATNSLCFYGNSGSRQP